MRIIIRERVLHYVVYLDEFGHVGPFVGRNHKRYNDSPVFGLAGVVLPVDQVREFAKFFYELKCGLLSWEIQQRKAPLTPLCQWEKKGSTLYTVKNVTDYRELRTATNRYIKKIGDMGGFIFYTGERKTAEPGMHSSKNTFKRALLESIRKLDAFCIQNDSTFMLILDHQDAGDDWRAKNVEACTLAMFEGTQKLKTLIEPPVQAESHLFQTLQCADWICGVIGRLMAFEVAAEEYKEWDVFKKYFNDRITKQLLTSSGLENEKDAVGPVEKSPSTLPDAPIAEPVNVQPITD